MNHNRELAKSLAEAIQAEKNECFRNAVLAMMTLKVPALYIEGLVLILGALYIEHGWLVVDNQIVNPTIFDVDASDYHAVHSYSAEEVRKLIHKAGGREREPLGRGRGFTLPIVDHFKERRIEMSRITLSLYQAKQALEHAT